MVAPLQEIFEMAIAKEEAGGLDDAARAAAAETQAAATAVYHGTMDAYGVDLLVCPTGGPAWPIEPKDDFTGGMCTSLAAVAGAPLITLPAGEWKGLPLGVALLGRRFSEPMLIAAAHALEQRLPPAITPRYIPTVGSEVESQSGNTGLKDAAADLVANSNSS